MEAVKSLIIDINGPNQTTVTIKDDTRNEVAVKDEVTIVHARYITASEASWPATLAFEEATH